jgi:hypothetical protein
MKIRHRLGMKQHLPSRPSLVRLPFMKTLPRHMALYRSVRVRPASDLALLYPSLLADEKRERNCVALQNSMSGGRRAGCYSDHVYRGRASGFPAQNRLDFRRIVRIGVRWFSSSMSSCCRAAALRSPLISVLVPNQRTMRPSASRCGSGTDGTRHPHLSAGIPSRMAARWRQRLSSVP